MTYGKKLWAIAEGYIPEDDNKKSRERISHETACILNTCDEDANVQIMLYFSDQVPAGPYKINIPAKRTYHIRFDELKDPSPVPIGVDFASVITSNVPIIVQHTRLDTRWGNNALLSTIAYSE